MKRVLAVLTALWMLGACALAEEPIASYTMPEGGEVCHVLDSASITAPAGLEGMYDLMRQTSLRGDVYLVRMPHGRALCSVSCEALEAPVTAEELLALWPAIAENLGESAAWVDSRAECAAVEELYGYPALHIRTRLRLNDGLTLNAEGFAFCRERMLREVWAVHPEDGEEERELAEDLDALEAFRGSLHFPAGEEKGPSGMFELRLPQDARTMDARSGDAERELTRLRYFLANGVGAGRMFEIFLDDCVQNDALYVFDPGMRGVVALTASPVPGAERLFAPDRLEEQSQSILEILRDMFDKAELTEAGERVTISGREHSLLRYEVHCGLMRVNLDVLCCAAGDWLFEVDVYTPADDETLRDELLAWAGESLTYHLAE